MFARLAINDDVDRIVEMAGANIAETRPGDTFDPAITRETVLRGLRTASPTLFVVENRRQIVGFLSAEIQSYDYKAGICTIQRVFYVAPENRGTRAAVLLMRQLIDWSRQLGAIEILGGNDNAFRSEQTARFLAHFGFEKIGYAMTLRLNEG